MTQRDVKGSAYLIARESSLAIKFIVTPRRKTYRMKKTRPKCFLRLPLTFYDPMTQKFKFHFLHLRVCDDATPLWWGWPKSIYFFIFLDRAQSGTSILTERCYWLLWLTFHIAELGNVWRFLFDQKFSNFFFEKEKRLK